LERGDMSPLFLRRGVSRRVLPFAFKMRIAGLIWPFFGCGFAIFAFFRG